MSDLFGIDWALAAEAASPQKLLLAGFSGGFLAGQLWTYILQLFVRWLLW
ncbi:MAG: hypothetical protein AAGG09_06465 [Pseudomonadota bacterium]